jgi:hypothetical protein
VTYGLIDGPVSGWIRPAPLASEVAGALLLVAFRELLHRGSACPEAGPAPQQLLHCALDAPASHAPLEGNELLECSG